MPIHKTLSDEDGIEYVLVTRSWKQAITGLIIAGLVMLAIAIVALLLMYRDIDELTHFKEVTKQRRLAFDEMLTQRARVQQWTFEQSCNYAQSKGEKCLQNPKWWADPSKYPLLVGEDGTGLVPHTIKEDKEYK